MKKYKSKPTELSKKYFVSFLIVVLAIDLLISVALSTSYCTFQVQRATENDISQLEQACNSTDILYSSLEAVVNQVITDSRAISFLFTPETDRLQEAGLGIYLRSLRTANPYMRYITLYNSTSKRFVSSSDAGYDTDLGANEIYSQLGSKPYACFVRNVGSVHVTQKEKKLQTYSFVFPVGVNPRSTGDFLIIDVKDSYFYQALSPIRAEGVNQTLLLCDAQNTPIAKMTADGNDDSFTVLPATTDDLPEIADNEDDGSFFFGSLPHRTFVSYASAQQAGWTIYNIRPALVVYSGVGSVLLLSAAMMLATFAVGWLLSRKLSSTLYAPIKELYEDYVAPQSTEKKGNELELLSHAFSEMYSKADRLEQGLISSYRESKNMYLRYIFSGEIEKVHSAASTYQRLQIDISAPFYSVIIMECVPQATDENRQNADLFICFYALENITREVLSAARSVEFMRIGESSFAVLLGMNSDLLSENMRNGLNTVAATMQREFHIDTTICVGNTASSLENVNLAYEQAMLALNSHSPNNYGRVFSASSASQAMSSDVYFNKLHTRLAEHIRNEDSSACAEEFDTALTSMEDISFNTAKTYFNHILMSVLDDFSTSLDRDDASFESLMEYLGKIDGCQNVQSLKGVFIAFVNDLCRCLSHNKKNSNQDAAMQAKEYIDNNYQNPDISLRMLAEKIGLSPAYLGKVFTAVTTYTFNDYLNSVRAAHAAELLTTTKLPVSKISEEVGILNTNYFYAVFKKRYGTTPSAYRKSPTEEK